MDLSSSGNENVTPPTPSSNANSNFTPNPTSNISLRGKNDPAWAHVAFKKDGTQNIYTCLHCGNSYRGGGINRLKQHLAGVVGQIASCKKVPADVRYRMTESLKETTKKKEIEDIREDGVEEEEVNSEAKKRKPSSALDKYFAPRTTPGAQPTIKSVLASKEAQHNVKMLIAEWAIVNCIPFKALECPLFQKAVDGMCAIGPGFKAPSAYDFKTNLLREWKKERQLLVDGHREKWQKKAAHLWRMDGLM